MRYYVWQFVTWSNCSYLHVFILNFQGCGLELGHPGDAQQKEAASHLASPPPPPPPPPPNAPNPVGVVGMAQSNINIVKSQQQYVAGSPGAVMPNVGVGPPNNNQQPPLPPQGVSPPGSAVIPPLPPQPSAPQPPQPQLQAEVKSDTSAKISQNNQKSAVNQNLNPPPQSSVMGPTGVNSANPLGVVAPTTGPRNGSSGGPGSFANNHGGGGPPASPGQQTNKSTLASHSDTAVATVPKRPRKISGAPPPPPPPPGSGVGMPFPMQAKNAQSNLSTLENVSGNFFVIICCYSIMFHEKKLGILYNW